MMDVDVIQFETFGRIEPVKATEMARAKSELASRFLDVPGAVMSRVVKGIERVQLQEALALLDAQGDRHDRLFPNESFELLRGFVSNDAFWGDSTKTADVVAEMRALLQNLESAKKREILGLHSDDVTLADVVFGPKKVRELDPDFDLNRAQRRAKLSREKRERKARARAKEHRK